MLKKAEHFWKGLSHNRSQISPVPSQSYGERFIHFIEGITMSKEEAERQELAHAQEGTSQEWSRSSHGFRRSSVEGSMQVAEKEAAKDASELHSHTLTTIRDPTDSSSIGGPAILPVVEEAGEAGSTGSRGSQNNRDKPSRPYPETIHGNDLMSTDGSVHVSDTQAFVFHEKGKGKEPAWGSRGIHVGSSG
jgi:1-phosphatidylinositol-4-phosphate 5-kinase